MKHIKLGNYYANYGGKKPYLEKKSNAYLDDFTRNAGSKNYTKFAVMSITGDSLDARASRGVQFISSGNW